MDNAGPLKLLVVGLSWPPETFLRRLLLGLAESGIEVAVATPERPVGLPLQWIRAPAWRGSAARRLLRSGLGAALAGARSPAESKLVLGGIQGLEARQRAREQHRFAPLIGRDWDVLYLPWNSAAAAHLPMFKIPKPVVVSCRGAQINIAPTNPSRRAEVSRSFAALDQATSIHCVSHALRRVVEAHVDVGEKIRVIHPAVDPSFFSPVELAGRTDNPFQITTVGSLIWRKGYENLLQAMGSLRDSGVKAHLRIIGDGPERERILFTLRDLGLGQLVDLVGPLDESKVRDELRQADLFVLSSLSEGISNAALEAMSCGLPVVTTRMGGMAEAIRDGVEGRLVPPRDPDAMAEAITLLCTHRELRLTMGAAARDRVVNHFNLEDHIGAWNELLGSVVEGDGAAVKT